MRIVLLCHVLVDNVEDCRVGDAKVRAKEGPRCFRVALFPHGPFTQVNTLLSISARMNTLILENPHLKINNVVYLDSKSTQSSLYKCYTLGVAKK